MVLTRGNILLFGAALLWGFGFLFQKYGSEHMGPFAFNAFRFFLGALVVLPVIYFTRPSNKNKTQAKPLTKYTFIGGICAGFAMFLAAFFQQYGIAYTTISNAGFITGLSVMFVPALGFFLKHRYPVGTWASIMLSCFGLYLLTGVDILQTSNGDFWILISAAFWAVHVLTIDKLTNHHRLLVIAAIQFFTCAILSYIGAFITDDKIILTTFDEWIWVIINGILVVGIGFTLQVLGQKTAAPGQAAIIISLEAVFAAIAGYLFLAELLSLKALIGCALMLTGCIAAQFFPMRTKDQTSLSAKNS